MVYIVAAMANGQPKEILGLLICCLLAASALLLAGCAAPSGGVEEPSVPALVFSTPESSYRLTAECIRHAQAEEDEAGRAFVEVRLKPSAECSGKAAAAVFTRVGERMSVTYHSTADNAHELSRDVLLVTPIDPASPLRISVKSEAWAMEIAAGLSESWTSFMMPPPPAPAR